MNDKFLVELVENLGADMAAVIPVSQMRFDRRFRELCESNACGNFGRCWTCPPDAGEIDLLISTAKRYQKALVYQTIHKLEDSYDFEGMMAAGKEHNRLAQNLSAWVRTVPDIRWLHLGAGGCKVCDTCAKQEDLPCRFPDLAMASLETYGVSVSDLAKACGMKYVNGENTVTYFGALLFCETEKDLPVKSI